MNPTEFGTLSRQIIDQEVAKVIGMLPSFEVLHGWRAAYPDEGEVLFQILRSLGGNPDNPRPDALTLSSYPILAAMLERIDNRLAGLKADPESAKAAFIRHASEDSF